MNKEELKQKLHSHLKLTMPHTYSEDWVNSLFYWIETNIISQLEKEMAKVENQHPYKQAGNRDSYSKYNEGWSDACDVIRQSLIPTEKKQ